MFTHHSKQKLLLTVLSILVGAMAFTSKAGLDSYTIYLNDKLILKQYVNQPLTLESLGLTQANINDKLVIHYEQCNVPNKLAKSRSIHVKDASGNTIKKWNFADAKDGRTGMIIPVRELLGLEKNKSLGKLSLYYTAEGHPSGQLLANFHFESKATTYQKERSILTVNYAMHLIFPMLLVI